MKQGLSLRVSQHLALTPQLQQSIRLLQLSTLELNQEVEQMLADNPFLELDIDSAPREEFGLAQADTPIRQDDMQAEVAADAWVDAASATRASRENEEEAGADAPDDGPSWEGDGSSAMTPDDSEWGAEAPGRSKRLNADDDSEVSELAPAPVSLQSYLLQQALGLRLGEEDRAALWFLIESLNDDGYLEDSLTLLAQGFTIDNEAQLEQLLHSLTVALGLLQSLEPTGVGARNLAECLTLQLQALLHHEADPARMAVLKLALCICDKAIGLLARHDLRRMVAMCGASAAAVRQAIALIARLEPKPGRRFCEVERNIVVPDVLVVKLVRGASVKFQVRLNTDVLPQLRVHDIYAAALKGHKGSGSDSAGFAALQQRLQEARWFIKNIRQRFDTILRVSRAIVERQKNFFVHGALAMRPLVLREIADELGLHESTISRVTTAKYMATPFGTFELKYFFGSGLSTDSGGNASSTAVRALIKQFIAAELPTRPLSDQQLCEMLQEQGIACARRTVAKYREALRIATASLRKKV